MTAVTPEPINSWTLSYGQALLVKHILILPLLVFAFVNGHLVKRKRRDSGYQPVAWARSEGVLIWLIYIVTGYMNQHLLRMRSLIHWPCMARELLFGSIRVYDR